MTHSDAGKGDAPRKQQDQKAYEEGWDRIFRNRPKEKAIEEEPLKETERDD
jgi:hypothetical protein